MGEFLEFLKRSDGCHLIEPSEQGFALVRKSDADAGSFNALVRRALDCSGSDYVALPRTDGRAGYDQVFIIPLN